jgi:hypothetical protein
MKSKRGQILIEFLVVVPVLVALLTFALLKNRALSLKWRHGTEFIVTCLGLEQGPCRD